MDRQTIKRLAFVATLIAMIITVSTFTAFAAPRWNSNAEETVSKALQSIGVEDGTFAGFYEWSFGKIASCLTDMDEAMEGATGRDHNLSGIFSEAISDTLTDFADVGSEEEAINKLDQIINEAGSNH